MKLAAALAAFFLFISPFLFLLSTLAEEPWSGSGGSHPVTLDALHGPGTGQIFSPHRLFEAKPVQRANGPFDMLFHFYEHHLTTFNGSTCRYYPTCSAYAKESIQKFGLAVGIVVGAERFMRCHEYQTDEIFDPVRLW